MSRLPGTIPLFPLDGVVLFPRTAAPLHIFEPRYREMVRDSWAADRVIGMVALRPGYEDEYYQRPAVYPIGCAGKIEECEPLPDGRYNIILRGTARFRVRREHSDKAYRRADVEPAPERIEKNSELEGYRGRVLSAVAAASSRPTLVVVQPDVSHELFVNTLCQMLPLEAVEKLSLLECDSLAQRYERLLELLEFKRLANAVGGTGSAGPN